MSASDALIVSAVDEVQRAVQLEAAKSQKKLDLLMEENRQQREEARQQTKMLEDQVSKLTSMMEVLLKTRVEQALGGEGVDLSQDDGKARPELEKAMDEQMRAENVRDLESRMPVPANEDRRVEVVQRMGFSAEDVQDLVGDADPRRARTRGAGLLRRRRPDDGELHRRHAPDRAVVRAGREEPRGRRVLASENRHFVSARHQEERRHPVERLDGGNARAFEAPSRR